MSRAACWASTSRWEVWPARWDRFWAGSRSMPSRPARRSGWRGSCYGSPLSPRRDCRDRLEAHLFLEDSRFSRQFLRLGHVGILLRRPTLDICMTDGRLGGNALKTRSTYVRDGQISPTIDLWRL